MGESRTNIMARFGLGRISMRRALFLLAGFIATIVLLKITFASSKDEVPIVAAKPHSARTLVVSSMKKDNTSWIEEGLPDWTLRRYIVDDPTATYTVPQNKGREAMVYLT